MVIRLQRRSVKKRIRLIRRFKDRLARSREGEAVSVRCKTCGVIPKVSKVSAWRLTDAGLVLVRFIESVKCPMCGKRVKQEFCVKNRLYQGEVLTKTNEPVKFCDLDSRIKDTWRAHNRAKENKDQLTFDL